MISGIQDLAIKLRPPGGLSLFSNNARTHSPAQIDQIVASIKTFGWTNPILIDDAGGVIAGHGRLLAAQQMGLAEVPTIALSGMSEAQKRAYIIADNKLAENAGWDTDLLSIELIALDALELDFDLSVIGFDTPELDLLLNGQHVPDEPPAPDIAPGSPISQPGDLWLLGDHRLLCADALKRESYTALLGKSAANATFTDPPYNVKIDGHVCRLGKVKHDEFMMASGEMSPEEFRAFLQTFCQAASRSLLPGAISFVCMDWRHISDLLEAGKAHLGDLINICVWNKMTGGMGSLYRSQHELVSLFRNSGASHRNNVQLGKHGRNRTNVWDYTGVQARKDELKLHPTVKPVAMIADALLDVTARGDIVLDPFAGSGSTLMAAHQTGRVAACLELDPKYVDVIIRRYQAATGQEAVHQVWQQTFSEIETELKETANV